MLWLLLLAQDGTEFFEAKIRPILDAHCLSCHGEKKAKGGLRLDSKAGWEKGGDSGKALVPGKPGSSLLIRMIKGGGESPPEMPPENRLPPEAVADLVKWVELGAPDPRAGAATSAAKAVDWSAARTHWAYRPLPESSGASVDSLIGFQGVRPAPAADRWTLIRRATIGLTGLPPTAEEVDAFVNDSTPGAWAKVVDRLLASTAYGEQQARAWLDLARYAEDQAHVDQGKMPHAWRYRDWVVEAFNRDIPYDRFVKLQLAADLMGAEPAELRALGFLGLGAHYARPNDLQRARAEEWDDRVDTLTRSFLGLTVSCARCHDHKYDPIPTLDYYSLAGVIASTKNAIVFVGSPEERAVYDAAAARAKEAADQAASFLRHKRDSLIRDDVVELRVPADVLRKHPCLQEEVERAFAKDRNGELLKKLSAAWPEKKVVEAATPEWRADYERLKKEADARAALVPPEPPKAHGVADEKPADLKVFVRGNPYRHGEPAPRRFLRALAGPEPARFTKGSGRLELAEAVVAHPLAARVLVNRVWQRHFGRGLVATASNFGALGEAPTHPELLDVLAARFTREGMSIKRLQREILLSAAYQRASTGGEGQDVDPENRRLWRMSRRRLTVEELRDAWLAASGELDRTAGGPGGNIDELAFARRALYARVSRLDLAALPRLFDFPDPNLTSERRTETTLPQQSLFLMNSPFMLARAKALAGKAAGAADPLREIFRRALARDPSPTERAAAAGADPESLAHALLMSNAFLFVE